MESYKKIIEAHFNATVIIGYDNNGYDIYEEVGTADGYEIFIHLPEGRFKNVVPDEDIYYYVDDMADAIKEHIKAGGDFYVSESIAEQLYMNEEGGEFWQDMCEEENLLDEELAE